MSIYSQLVGKDSVMTNKLWNVITNEEQYNAIVDYINKNPYQIRPRDAAMLYAGWWKYKYESGTPSKKTIHKILDHRARTIVCEQELYSLAKQGAELLNVSWIRKRNTLFFRSILMQGGIPLKFIENHHGKYEKFLEELLDSGIDSVEEIVENQELINLLPVSGRNESIYDSSLEIIEAIRNGEDTFIELTKENKEFASITSALTIKAKVLKNNKNQRKHRVDWLFDRNKLEVKIKIDIPNKYTADSLAFLLGLNVDQLSNKLTLCLNDNPLCIFRKLNNGEYLTDWIQKKLIKWDEQSLCKVTVYYDGRIQELKDFIRITPTFQRPTFWESYDKDVFKYVQANATNKDVAIVLVPLINSESSQNVINIEKSEIRDVNEFLEFNWNGEFYKYRTNTKSFNWLISTTQVNHISKPTIPLVRKTLKVRAFDDKNQQLKEGVEVYFKRASSKSETWLNSKYNQLPLGCVDIKVSYDNIEGYDCVYNIGDFNIDINYNSLNKSIIKVNKAFQSLRIQESDLFKAQSLVDSFHLQLNYEKKSVPVAIDASLKYESSRQVNFKIDTPFAGLALINNEGEVCVEKQKISFHDLSGYRLLTSPNSEVNLRFCNTQKGAVKIYKTLNEVSIPLINYKDDFEQLFNLHNVMDFENAIELEIREGNHRKVFYLSSYSHEIKDQDLEYRNLIELKGGEVDVDLIAIPLNCHSDYIRAYELEKNNNYYLLPDMKYCKEFVVTSNFTKGSRVMPRYACIEDKVKNLRPTDRIYLYASDMIENNTNEEVWTVFRMYIKLCIANELPFSCFDQIRALVYSSEVAAKAFIYLSTFFSDSNEFVEIIKKIERDLGICFHWIKQIDWIKNINSFLDKHSENDLLIDLYQKNISEKLSSYFSSIQLEELFLYTVTKNIVDDKFILQTDIREMKQKLGAKILEELPVRVPIVKNSHDKIRFNNNDNIQLLFNAPIAVGESITNSYIEKYSLWGDCSKKDAVRRNIQYCKVLDTSFYKKVMLYVLKNS
ncbi:MAG: hypothetical protein ABF244_05585 [Flavobacteriaceae bacterium]